VNRQSRALLTILIVAAILIPYWLLTRTSEPPASAVAGGEDPDPTRGGSVVASSRTDPRSFNRLVQPELSTDIFAMLTLGRLVRINRQTYDVEPWLAEKWVTSPDNRTFTLTLRDGVTWSDGVPFSADDVLFSFRALYDPRTASPMASSISVDGQPLQVSSPDPRTVVITYPAVFGPGIRLLDNLTMFPKHKLEGALNDGTFAKAWGAGTPPSEMLAIGPYVLTQYQPAQRLIFERNPRYWRKDARGAQLPYLDRLTIELIPDQAAELVRLQSGQTDFTQQSIQTADIETLRPLQQQGRIRIDELGVSTDPDAFTFNLRSDKWQNDPRGAWFMRKEFRQALSHAVDREAFADAVHLGAAVPIHGPITPGNTRWFWPSIPRYEFSLEKARALLQTIGLANRDQDEWLEDEQGGDAQFSLLLFRGNVAVERSAAVLREDFRKVGVAMDLVPLEANAVRSRVVTGDFEAALINFTGNLDPAMNRDFWMSFGGAHFWNTAQKTPATEWERQIDALMTKQSAVADEEERKRLFNDVQRIFSENLPMLHFAAPRVYIATSSRLINLKPSLSRPPLIWSADELAVKPGPASQ
jgi:peptide/nickel transport system substrate-binding protein